MKIKARIKKQKRGWVVTLVAANGETVAQSEPYFSKWNAKRYVRKLLGPDVVIEEG